MTALCDIDSARLERAEARVLKESGAKPKTYREMRKAFEDKDVDAVSIVTPNHWHALSTIWACQAGKDVYSEKPASHNIWEGRKLVNFSSNDLKLIRGKHTSAIAAILGKAGATEVVHRDNLVLL